MVFHSVDPETRDINEITETRTLREISRCVSVSITRWLMSGQDCPNGESTDGMSLQEAAMEF